MRKHTPTEAAILAEFKKIYRSLWNICDLAGEQSTEEPTVTIGESHWFCDNFPDEMKCSLDEFASGIGHYINHLENPTPFSYVCERENCDGLLTVYQNGVWAQCPVCKRSQIVDDISAPRNHYEARKHFGDAPRCTRCNDSSCHICPNCDETQCGFCDCDGDND